MDGAFGKGVKGRIDYENVVRVLEVEDEEEEDYNSDDDYVTVGSSRDVTAIADLKTNSPATFRGKILWKKECFLARDGKTFISRVRVGDARNHKSFVQISAFGINAKWIDQNLKENTSYEFSGLKFRKSNRRYIPISHSVEAIFYMTQSSITEVDDILEYPDRLYYDFKCFDYISALTSSTCVEIVGVVKTVGKVIYKGEHRLLKITLVDSSKFKIEFYIWNEDLVDFNWRPGTTLILQGLKVMFHSDRVDFAALRCKHIEIDSPIEEAVQLKWWWDNGGSNMEFVDFPKFKDRFKLFTGALCYYNDNKGKEKLTIKALAMEFGIERTQLNRFFNCNGIRVNQPEKVNECVEKVLKRNEGEKIKDFVVEGVTVDAIKSALGRKRLTTPRGRTSYNPELIEKLIEKYRNKRDGETLISICGYNQNLATVVSLARAKNNETKKIKSNPKNPEKVWRAILFYIEKKGNWKQKRVVDYFNVDDKGKLLPESKRITVDAVKNALTKVKKNNPNNWEQYIRDKVNELNKKC